MSGNYSPFGANYKDARETIVDDEMGSMTLDIPEEDYEISTDSLEEQIFRAEKKPTDFNFGEEEEKSESNPTENNTGMTNEFAMFTAKWLVNVYSNTLTMWLKEWAKIDKKAIYEAVLNGHLDEKYLDVVDKENKKVEEKLVFSEEQKKFIVEPLTQFVKINNVQVPSGLQVIIGLAVVSGSVFMQANTIRKDNQYVLQRILRETQMRASLSTKKSNDIDDTIQVLDDDEIEESSNFKSKLKDEDDGFEHILT